MQIFNDFEREFMQTCDVKNNHCSDIFIYLRCNFIQNTYYWSYLSKLAISIILQKQYFTNLCKNETVNICAVVHRTFHI